MYTATAGLYDLIYARIRDYADDAAGVAARIRAAHPAASSVLDVACGTGEHARLLAEQHGFEVDAVDLDPVFVEVARAKLPGARIVQGDMCSLELGRRYDAILCLFSSIGYVRTLDNVRRTLERFRAHLAEDGVVLVEPWFPPGVLNPDLTFVHVAEGEDVKVCRMSRTDVDGCVSRTHFEYLIGRPGGIERASEVHELGLFTPEELLTCFHEAGFDATHQDGGSMGRGIFLARAAAPG